MCVCIYIYIKQENYIGKGIETTMNKKSTVQPLSENTRKAIIIAAIVVVAVIILSIALALILKPATVTPDDQNTPGSGSSSLTIRNGDFEYTSSEDTAYPLTAQNWMKKGYAKKTGSTHTFADIEDNDKALMGIVDVSDDGWKTVAADLKAEGLTVTNPGVHKTLPGDKDSEDDNNKVYMIATREATAVSILSDPGVSISSGASVKITIWLNTKYLDEGSKAVVMIQKSALYATEENWYAYDFEVDQSSKYENDGNGWQKLEFYVFNRDAGSKYVRVSIGIGNVYSGEKNDNVDFSKYADDPIVGSGVLFIDDITYETVTANDYREQVDAEGAEKSTMFKIIENEDIVDKSEYLELVSEVEGVEPTKYTSSKQFIEDSQYSPFTERDDFKSTTANPTGFTIYKLSSSNLQNNKALALRLSAPINVKSSLLLKDHHHISFWVRVNEVNKVDYANIYVQKQAATGEWENLESGSWTAFSTSQDIEEDTNCGWVKYDIYLKPSAGEEKISVLFVLGNKDGYSEEDVTKGVLPKGDLYVTSPAYEVISYSDYSSASTGNSVRKLDLIGTSSSTNITNGSFSTLDSSGRQPASWTQAFGGSNSIFRDGKGNTGNLENNQMLAKNVADSGTVQNYDKPVQLKDGTLKDTDTQNNVLRIKNDVATSFGYYSSNITLSARTVYAISVMFRSDEGKNPYIYLIDTDTEKENREDRIIASVTSTAQKESGIVAKILNHSHNNDEFGEGWARYYMIVVTGNESMTVRMALFNGSILGNQEGANDLQSGTVFYDKVEMYTVNTYSLVEADDDEKEENPEYETLYKVDWATFAHVNEDEQEIYGENFSELLTKTVSDVSDVEGNDTLLLESWGISVHQPTEEQWNEMRVIPEDKDDTDNGPKDETKTEPKDVDLGLLFSVISSVALLAALLVVFVIRVYKNKGNFTKAA